MSDFGYSPFEVEVDGHRCVVQGAAYDVTKQALYSQQQLDESTAVPPPLATPVVEASIVLSVVVLSGHEEMLGKLQQKGVPVEVSMRVEGMR